MLLETGGQNSHWGYHVPSMMNVLDFEVLNGSPGDKQTNKRLWKEVYQTTNGMKSLKEKKTAKLDQGGFWQIPALWVQAWSHGVCVCTSTSIHVDMTMTSEASGSVSATDHSIHIPLTALHGIVTVFS